MDHNGIDVHKRDSQIYILAERSGDHRAAHPHRARARRVVGNITPVLRHCRHLPAWHSADDAPAIVRRSCQSQWAWSNGSGWRAGDPDSNGGTRTTEKRPSGARADDTTTGAQVGRRSACGRTQRARPLPPVSVSLRLVVSLETLAHKRLPVVALRAASVMAQDRQKIMAAGFDGFHGKPISMREKLATMRGILERS